MNMKIDVPDNLVADAMESIDKANAQAQAQAQTENPAEEDHVIDENTLESEVVTEAQETAPEPEPAESTEPAPAEAAETEAEPAEPSASEFKDQLMRLAADFENFKKRTRREKEDIRKFANEQLLKDILNVPKQLE